jgi:hypothetical protein
LFTYTPNAGYTGPDSFTYKANDGQLDSNVATATINVAPRPLITAVSQVTPSPRLSSVKVDVTFSEPVNVSTFTYSSLSLTCDGAAVPLTSAVTVSPVSGSTYRVSGLDPFTAASGSYTLTVDASKVSDASGNPGAGSSSTSWVTHAVSFLGTDSATQGYWKGTYGTDGFVVPGDPSANNPTYPSYVTPALAGQAAAVWAPSTSDPRAAQQASGVGQLASCWYSSSSFSIDLSPADSLPHQVSVYALDWDNNGRTERIGVIDDATGRVLDTRSLSSFQNGVYLSWLVPGAVTLRVTNTGPTNAVLSGLFFGAPPTPVASAAYAGSDSATQGNWKSAYGAEGYAIPNDATSAPSYASLALSGANLATWADPTSDPRALSHAASAVANNRLASTWYSWGSFTIDVRATDSLTHLVTAYALDWDGNGRTERIDVIDDATGRVIDTRTLGSFQNGVYLTWKVTGSVTLRVTNTGPTNAVLSGVFFGS